MKSATVVDLGISDHSAISLNISWQKPKPLPQLTECRSFKKFDPDCDSITYSNSKVYITVKCMSLKHGTVHSCLVYLTYTPSVAVSRLL